MGWESYEIHCKELYSLTVRVLSLTCSATECERNWNNFDNVHTKKIIRLEQQRVNALVFVNSNINMELRQIKREDNDDSCDPIYLSDMDLMISGLRKRKNLAYEKIFYGRTFINVLKLMMTNVVEKERYRFILN